MFGQTKISIVALAIGSLLIIGCSATDISDHDAKVIETATADVDEFCDVVDGEKSVSLDSYGKLDENASNAVKKLISVYKKDPTGTFSPDGDDEKSSQSTGELLLSMEQKLASCDPSQAKKIRKALNGAA